MKKALFALALVMGVGASAFANNQSIEKVEITTTVNDFTPIELKDLPVAVTDSVAKNYSDKTIKEAFVELAADNTKTFKIVLVDKENTESTVLYNEKGEELKAVPVE